MNLFKHVYTGHSDIIHDVAYDFTGRRMATCSSDRQVRIWEQGAGGEWELQSTLSETHSGSIWRVRWAHPEFGNVLASCSFDTTVQIWEEKEDAHGKKTWRRVAQLVDSRQSVSDIAFGPKHLGLRLATASALGIIRIYEAGDIMNLSYWSLVDEFGAKLPGQDSTIAISWDQSPFSPPTLLTGTSLERESLQIWQKNSGKNKWQVLSSFGDEPVHCVAWAPNMGRSYHLVAAGSKNSVRIWEVRRNEALGLEPLDLKLVARFTSHQGDVWRVDWNVTGTILASSGDDGKVRLWKRNSKNIWHCTSTIDFYTDHVTSIDPDTGVPLSFETQSDLPNGHGLSSPSPGPSASSSSSSSSSSSASASTSTSASQEIGEFDADLARTHRQSIVLDPRSSLDDHPGGGLAHNDSSHRLSVPLTSAAVSLSSSPSSQLGALMKRGKKP